MIRSLLKISGNTPSNVVLLTGALCFVNAPWLMAGYGLDQAKLENADTSKWRCKFCPAEEGLSGSVEGFFGYSEEGIAQRFKNTEAEGERGQLAIDADLLKKTDTDQTHYSAEGLGDDNVHVALGYQDYQAFRSGLSFSRINHYFGEGAETLYPGQKTDALTLPPGWINQSSTTAMDFSTLYPVDNYLQRETLEAQARNRFGEDLWELSVHFRQQDRSGTGWKTGSILNDITALPAFRNDQLRELTLNAAVPFEYQKGEGSVGLEYFRSVYDNDYQTLMWENAFTPAIAGADQGQLAAAPDNQFRSWRLFAHYAREQHRFDLSYSQGQGEQDQDFLGYTTNSLLTTQALPDKRYDGEVETRHARIRWDYRISPQWQLKTHYRFNERDNLSEVLVYQPVLTDSLLQGSRENLRYSHKKTDFDINVDWRWRPQTRFGYLYEYERFSRERESSGESASHGLAFYWNERWTPELKTRAKIGAQEREERDHQTAPGDNPLYRDFTVADRLRNTAQLSLDWQYAANVQLSANASYRDDEFDKTQIGVTEAEERSMGVNLNWQVDSNLSANASLQRNWMTWLMSGSSQLTVPTWQSEQEDEFDVFTLGLRRQGLFNNRVAVGFNYSYVSSLGETQLASNAAYDEQSSDGHSLHSYLSYQWRPEWLLRVEVLYERYQTENPDILAVNTLPRVIGNSIEDDNYSHWLFGLRLKYQLPD